MPSTVEKWKLCYKFWLEVPERFGDLGATIQTERSGGRLAAGGDPEEAVACAREIGERLDDLAGVGDYLVSALDEASPKTFEFGLTSKYNAAYAAAGELKDELNEIASDWKDSVEEFQRRADEGERMTVSMEVGKVVQQLDGLFPRFEPRLGPLGQKISFKVKKQRKGEDD